MNPIDIINSSKYQELFLKYFTFENGKFISNQDSSKRDFLYNEIDEKSSLHDYILNNGFAFFESDQGIFLLFDNVIIYCNSEADLIPMGDNPVNFTFALAESDNIFDAHLTLNHQDFVSKVQELYGDMSTEIDTKKLTKLENRYKLS